MALRIELKPFWAERQPQSENNLVREAQKPSPYPLPYNTHFSVGEDEGDRYISSNRRAPGAATYGACEPILKSTEAKIDARTSA